MGVPELKMWLLSLCDLLLWLLSGPLCNTPRWGWKKGGGGGGGGGGGHWIAPILKNKKEKR